MTARDYFELLCHTSRRGGFPAYEPGIGGCRNRTSDGRKCAVGVLIPDEKYNSACEVLGPTLLAEEGYLEIPAGLTAYELLQIRSCHDAHPVPWHHEAFVEKLRGRVPAFGGLADPTASPCNEQGGNQ
jgi:hypothetical protein